MSRLLIVQKLIVGVASILIVMATAKAQATWYVDDDAPNDPGPGDPSVSDPLEDGSQEHPFDAIQEGINAAVNGDTVLVLDGTYSGTGNRDIDFGGKLITLRSQNGPDNCRIDCQQLGRGFYFHNGETVEAVVNGFIIQHGYASQSSPGRAYGGGTYNDGSSPTVTNCVFSGNDTYWTGGGMCNRNGSSPIVTNCTFIDNHARGFDGGGMYNADSAPKVINCTFAANVAHGGGGVGSYGGGMRNHGSSPTAINCTFTGNSAVYGGGMENGSSSPTVTNCTFSANTGTSWGGGMDNCNQSSPTVANCTFTGNSSSSGSGMRNANGSPTVTNCILWGDNGTEIYTASGTPVVTYCDVQGGYSGTGNIDGDPLFVDRVNGDYHLSAGSPCIDAADNDGMPPDTLDLDDDGDITEPIPIDLDCRLRCADRVDTPDTGNPGVPGPPIVDMGVYEYQCDGDLDGDGDIDLSDLAQLLANYGITTGACYTQGDIDLDTDVDLSDLAALLAVYGTTCD
jgi:hypothetical protein